jgi:hypothetical protein
MPDAGFLVAALAGGAMGHLRNPVEAGVSEPEGPGVGVDYWEAGGGEPMESELFILKESRVHCAIITMDSTG